MTLAGGLPEQAGQNKATVYVRYGNPTVRAMLPSWVTLSKRDY